MGPPFPFSALLIFCKCNLCRITSPHLGLLSGFLCYTSYRVQNPCSSDTLQRSGPCLLFQVSATKEQLLKILYRYRILSCPSTFVHGLKPTLPNFREISSPESNHCLIFPVTVPYLFSKYLMQCLFIFKIVALLPSFCVYNTNSAP